MKKSAIILFLVAASRTATAQSQKIDSIFFNLYTDSLKRGVHNYINIDGKTNDGKYLPLTSDEVLLTGSTGTWSGNSIIIDTGCKAEKIIITASLKEHPEIKRVITIWVKKNEEQPLLKSEEEVIEEYKKQGKNKKRQ